MRPVHVKEATGYKSTDIGMIPEDWDVYSLQDIVNQFINGGTPSTKNEDFWSGNIPWITGADILEQEVAVIRRHITAEAVDNSSTNVIPKGNLLIVSRTGVGKLAIAPCDIAISQDFTGILLRKEKILAGYLFRYLDFFQNVFIRQNQGTSIKGITRDTLAAILIAVPSSAEQRAIAETLSDADGLIKSLEALIEKRKAIKLAAMQQLLTGKTRLPGFSGAWETMCLGDLAHIETGNRNNQDKVHDGQYPFFVRSAIVERINSYSYQGEAILVPGEGDIGGIIHYVNGRFDVHQRVYKISQFSKNVIGKFVYYSMMLHFRNHARQNTVKAAVDSLRLPAFKSFSISLPKQVAEQTNIVAILSEVDAEIASLERHLHKTHALKQGMMQQLLTGRIRLKSTHEIN